MRHSIQIVLLVVSIVVFPTSSEDLAQLAHLPRRNVDPFCIEALQDFNPQTAGSRKFAVILRGEAYRNWGNYGNSYSCCNGSEHVQRLIAEAHHKHLFPVLESLSPGYSVDVFITTYQCTNGKRWVPPSLAAWYGERLKALVVADRFGGDDQWGPLQRMVRLVEREAAVHNTQYLGVLILRLDFLVTAFDECFIRENRLVHLGAVRRGSNEDQIAYVPGHYWRCFAKHAHEGSANMGLNLAVLEVMANQTITTHRAMPEACRHKLGLEKSTAEWFWKGTRQFGGASFEGARGNFVCDCSDHEPCHWNPGTPQPSRSS